MKNVVKISFMRCWSILKKVLNGDGSIIKTGIKLIQIEGEKILNRKKKKNNSSIR